MGTGAQGVTLGFARDDMIVGMTLAVGRHLVPLNRHEHHSSPQRRPCRRADAHHPRAVLRDDPRRSRRRGDQGRAGRRRPDPQAARLRRRLLRLLQPQQEEPRARCRLARRPQGAGQAAAVGRRDDRELRARFDGQARAGAGASRADQSAAGLLRAQGLPARAVREAAGARRGGADDGRAGLHDRPERAAAARRHLGGRHRGRHVRRLRHRAGAEAARPHRQGRAGRNRRCSSWSCS